MSKGARHRKARKHEQERRESFVRCFHGTAGIAGAYNKIRGLQAAERAGLLVCETPELAREHALAATARTLQDGAEDQRGLIVEAALPPDRLRPDPDAPGHYWVRDGIRPGEIVGMTYVDFAAELDDDELVEALADRFDTDSQDWRRAATGEMEA